jgi:NADPH:quinone reductase-like Zn-dependent oxidoreductase
MRAFAMNDFESQPSVMELPNPELGPGDVLVRVRASSLNGIDLATAGGMLQGMIDFQVPSCSARTSKVLSRLPVQA